MSIRWSEEELAEVLGDLFPREEISAWFRDPSEEGGGVGGTGTEDTVKVDFDVDLLVIIFLRAPPDSPLREKVLREVESRVMEAEFQERKRLLEPRIGDIRPIRDPPGA